MKPRAAVPLVAAATFVAGFGVAELTGVRAIGGLVLVAGGIWCGRLAVPIVGRRVTVALLAIALALFVLSHPLGKAIGAWPAVFVTATLVGAVAAAIVGSNRAAAKSRGSTKSASVDYS
jgi:predicted MFS family arabinose efflux permease